jgi:hypothetical protein
MVEEVSEGEIWIGTGRYVNEGDLVMFVCDERALIGIFDGLKGDCSCPDTRKAYFKELNEIKPFFNIQGVPLPVIHTVSEAFIRREYIEKCRMYVNEEVHTEGFSSKPWLAPYEAFIDIILAAS